MLPKGADQAALDRGSIGNPRCLALRQMRCSSAVRVPVNVAASMRHTTPPGGACVSRDTQGVCRDAQGDDASRAIAQSARAHPPLILPEGTHIDARPRLK